MSTIQNTFSLLVPAHIKTVELLGSWNNYSQRYSLYPDPVRGAGNFILTVNFTGNGSSRYWYYFILDGYFESHDPNEPTTVEPTRKITLNILDPTSAASVYSYSSSSAGSVSPIDSDASGHYSSSATSLSSNSPPYYKARSISPAGSDSSAGSGPRLIQPIPRHPLKLETNFDRYSMITTAATVSSNSPSSSIGGYSRSSRGVSPAGSICSSCSGTSFEDDSSPGTPICTCDSSAHPPHLSCPSPGALRYSMSAMPTRYGSDADGESSDSDTGSIPRKVRLSGTAEFAKKYTERMAARDAWELEQATRALRL